MRLVILWTVLLSTWIFAWLFITLLAINALTVLASACKVFVTSISALGDHTIHATRACLFFTDLTVLMLRCICVVLCLICCICTVYINPVTEICFIWQSAVLVTFIIITNSFKAIFTICIRFVTGFILTSSSKVNAGISTLIDVTEISFMASAWTAS